MSSVSSLYIRGGKHVPCELFVQRILDLLQELCTVQLALPNYPISDSVKKRETFVVSLNLY